MRHILALCVAFIVIGSACAIKCYECYACEGTGIEIDCDHPYAKCGKINSARGEITRTCEVGASIGCTNELGMEHCMCDTDLCNGAENLRGSTILATLVSAILAKILL